MTAHGTVETTRSGFRANAPLAMQSASAPDADTATATEAGEQARCRAMPLRVEAELKQLAEKHGIEQLILFGSRARGDYHRTSDIDLATRGGNAKLFSLDADEYTHTLLAFDCVDLDGPVHPDLRASIEREGVVLYEQTR